MSNRVIFTVFLFLASTIGASAQQESFQKGSAVMDLSIGTPTSSGCDNREVVMPPVTLTLDFGGPSGFIKKRSERGKKSSKNSSSKNGKGALGFGAILGFYQDDCWGWDGCYHYGHGHDYACYNYWYDADVYNVVTAFRFSFHIEPVKNMDAYIGLSTGGRFRIWNYNEEHGGYSHSGDDPKGHAFCLGPFTGMRYYFGNVFGLKAEFSVDTGSGFPNASAGMVFKLKN